MSIKVLETRDIDKSNDSGKATLIRVLEINGVRHIQMQGREHEIMPATWSDGVLMSCPETLSLDDVEADFERYYRGYGDGCEIVDEIPVELL